MHSSIADGWLTWRAVAVNQKVRCSTAANTARRIASTGHMHARGFPASWAGGWDDEGQGSKSIARFVWTCRSTVGIESSSATQPIRGPAAPMAPLLRRRWRRCCGVDGTAAAASMAINLQRDSAHLSTPAEEPH